MRKTTMATILLLISGGALAQSPVGPCRDTPFFEQQKEQERARYGDEAACMREAQLALRTMCEVPGKKLCSDAERALLSSAGTRNCEWLWGWSCTSASPY